MTHGIEQLFKGMEKISMLFQRLSRVKILYCVRLEDRDSTTRSSVTENILAGMKEHNVSTLVTCSSLGAGEHAPPSPHQSMDGKNHTTQCY